MDLLDGVPPHEFSDETILGQPGQYLLFTAGDYEDYAVYGLYLCRQPLTAGVLRAAYRQEDARDWAYIENLLERLVDEGVLAPLPLVEIGLGDGFDVFEIELPRVPHT